MNVHTYGEADLTKAELMDEIDRPVAEQALVVEVATTNSVQMNRGLERTDVPTVDTIAFIQSLNARERVEEWRMTFISTEQIVLEVRDIVAENPEDL